MSPHRLHTRHLTWPPNIHLLPKSMTKSPSVLIPTTTYTQALPALAEEDDPFAHFLSPVLEEEEESSPFDSSTYTAGITPYTEISSSKKDALFRARLEEKWETYVARRLLYHSKTRPGSTSVPAPLPPPFPQTPGTPPGEDALPDLMDEAMDTDVSTPDEGSSPRQMQWYFPSSMSSVDSECDFIDDEDMPDMEDDVDGWEADRKRGQVERSRTMANGRKVKLMKPKFGSKRTLSGKKHAWREPSWDLWTVDEEMEEEIEERGRAGKRRRVHWNEEVTVLEFER